MQQYPVGDVRHVNLLAQIEGDSLLVLTIRNYHGWPGVINLKHRITVNINETSIMILQPPLVSPNEFRHDTIGTDNNGFPLLSIWYKDEDIMNICLQRMLT